MVAAKPSPAFLVSHPAHFIALGFGAGLSPVAAGTVGTLVALPIAGALRAYGGDVAFVLAIAVALGAGAWAADRTGRDLGVADHSAIVCDEIAAFLLVLFLVGADPLRQAIAFVLFRVFDILKPPPASFIDRAWHHGFGVMADDIVAAFYTLVVFALGQRVFA
ncbi:MAG TPA: phosphatidylglycerophosphatase A [Casimicrobiaceae bacterium]|nr:phosphatidylglycerophosphatase A [Casimicrobiaceae bacterium]